MGINRSKTLQGKVERAEEKHHEQNAGRKGKETVDKSGNIYVKKKKKLQEKNRTFLEVSEKRASDKRGKIYGNLREKMRKKKNYTGHEKKMLK